MGVRLLLVSDDTTLLLSLFEEFVLSFLYFLQVATTATATRNETVRHLAGRVGLTVTALANLNRGMPGARGGRLTAAMVLARGTVLNIS